MSKWAKGLIALVAVLHIGFLVMEMFLWTTPLVVERFELAKIHPDFPAMSKALASNMGLYNGFLAAGLIWSLIAPVALGRQLALFFLGCVVIAGVFGAFTVKMSILFAQALPAAIAFLAVWLT